MYAYIHVCIVYVCIYIYIYVYIHIYTQAIEAISKEGSGGDDDKADKKKDKKKDKDDKDKKEKKKDKDDDKMSKSRMIQLPEQSAIRQVAMCVCVSFARVCGYVRTRKGRRTRATMKSLASLARSIYQDTVGTHQVPPCTCPDDIDLIIFHIKSMPHSHALTPKSIPHSHGLSPKSMPHSHTLTPVP